MISQQAPYGRVDFEDPPEGQTNLGALTATRLSVFPGSLGNYSGVDLTISKVTLEPPPAAGNPANQEIFLFSKIYKPSYVAILASNAQAKQSPIQTTQQDLEQKVPHQINNHLSPNP